MDDVTLAKVLEAESACLWNDWSAALALAAAACVAGEDLGAVRALPDPRGRPNRIVLQRGHVLDIGDSSIPQMLRLGGARAEEIGAIDRCKPGELDAVLREGAVAGLFVVAEGTAVGLIDLPHWNWHCHGASRPALVLLHGAGSHRAALDAGADLVILDAASLGGPSCGIVAGRNPLVGACRLQAQGIGRAMLPRPQDREALGLALGPNDPRRLDRNSEGEQVWA
jgi:seryl-tRNA(Sec) selenium transferase